MRGVRHSSYKVKCLPDGKIFDSVEDVCKHYGYTKDYVQGRLDDHKQHKDGINFERIVDNSEALKTVEAVDSSAFVEKFGDKTVPVPGYEGKYTISTKGVVTNTKTYDKVIPVKTTVKVKHTVILHSLDNKQTQTHSLINLMKKAFGDPEAEA